MKTYNFRIVVEPDGERWHAYCPALLGQGGATWGHTQQEALKNIQEDAYTLGGKTKAYKFSHSARSMPESRRILDKRPVPMSPLCGFGTRTVCNPFRMSWCLPPT